jgi:hypothetical protein
MGRGDRAKVRWAHDRVRRKKEARKRAAEERAKTRKGARRK